MPMEPSDSGTQLQVIYLLFFNFDIAYIRWSFFKLPVWGRGDEQVNFQYTRGEHGFGVYSEFTFSSGGKWNFEPVFLAKIYFVFSFLVFFDSFNVYFRNNTTCVRVKFLFWWGVTTLKLWGWDIFWGKRNSCLGNDPTCHYDLLVCCMKNIF